MLLAAGAVAAVLVAAAVALALFLRGPDGLSSIGPTSVGVIDPATNELLADIPLGFKSSLIAAGERFIWVVDPGGNTLTNIDPKTMEITEYLLPDGARPRRIAVDQKDVVWYTDYARGFLGRLDVRTKDVKEFASPGGPRSQPYGISVTSDGAVWYSESGVQPNTLVRFDPAASGFQKWDIPSGGGVVRHMVTAPNGDLLLACSGVDKVARVRIRKTT